jgi:hypothetical protein
MARRSRSTLPSSSTRRQPGALRGGRCHLGPGRVPVESGLGRPGPRRNPRGTAADRFRWQHDSRLRPEMTSLEKHERDDQKPAADVQAYAVGPIAARIALASVDRRRGRAPTSPMARQRPARARISQAEPPAGAKIGRVARRRAAPCGVPYAPPDDDVPDRCLVRDRHSGQIAGVSDAEIRRARRASAGGWRAHTRR